MQHPINTSTAGAEQESSYFYEYHGECEEDLIGYDDIYPASNKKGCGTRSNRSTKRGKEKKAIYSSRHTRLQARNKGSARK